VNELDKIKARYEREITDGRKVEAFMNTEEWKWYVESVINPTIEEYVRRIMNGEIATDKEDWIARGIVMGLKMIVETPNRFSEVADRARQKAKDLKEFENG